MVNKKYSRKTYNENFWNNASSLCFKFGCISHDILILHYKEINSKCIMLLNFIKRRCL